jgi:hypothetical protein
MSRFRRSIVVAAGAIVVAIVPIGLSYGRASMAAAQTVRLPEIESPRTWIPFSAIVTKPDPTGEVVVGHFYRSDDASERLESGPSLSDVKVISIKNMTQMRTYVFGATGWKSRPMRPATNPEVYQPPRMRLSAKLTRWPYTIAVSRGQDGSLASKVVDAYQRVSGGSTFLLVPSLNFFVIDRRDSTGVAITFHDVDITQNPPAELFEPPAGVSVTFDSQPVGNTPDHTQH